MKRRDVIIGGTVVLFSGLAGCGGDGESGSNGDDGATGGNGNSNGQAATEAVLGELVEGDKLQLVVEDTETTTEIGPYSEAEEGHEYVVVHLAVKNIADEHLYPMLETSVRDAGGTSYDRAYTHEATSFHRHPELVPGEIERGTATFELPTDVTAALAYFELATEEWGVESLAVDLQEQTDVHSLEQNLRVDLHQFDDALGKNGVKVAVRDISVKPGVMKYPDQPGYLYEPKEGNEFVVVEVAITNETGADLVVDPVHQLMARDGAGGRYDHNRGATRELTDALGREEDDWTIGTGESLVAQVPHDIPEGQSPLYWGFIYDLDEAGTKTLWQLR